MTTAALEIPSRVSWMTLTDALDMGEQVWDGLLARSGCNNPFMSWAWHRAWAHAVSRAERDACRAVVLTSSAGQVEALFPLRLHQTRFHRAPLTAVDWTVGDLGCPDHLELLASPEADLTALVATLEDLPWDVMRLENVAEGSASIQRFQQACRSRGWTVRTRPLWRCPYLELPSSWEDLVSSLGRSSRHNIRRYERHLHKHYDVRVTDYATRWEEGWRHLRQLHGRRWDGEGALRAPHLETLHRWFGTWLAERDRLWLVTLDLDGVPAAAWYGFSSEDTHYAYQAGWDPQHDGENVSTVLMTLMIRRAIERGLRTFDFLRGEEWYKTHWTGKARTCYELVVMRTGWRGALVRGLDWVARRRSKIWVPPLPRTGT